MMKALEGCTKVKLKDIAESIDAGGTPRRDVTGYWNDGDIPWLKISDLKSTYISDSEEKITRKGLENSSAKMFPEGTVLFSIFATLGATGILKKPSTTNQAIAGIVPNRELVSTKYLYYALKAERKKIIAKKTHSTQDNINLTVLRNHEVLLPTREIQKDIVSVLEKAEQLEDWRKEADKVTDDYLNSMFLKMFGDPEKNPRKWVMVKINDVVEYSQYGTSVKSNSQGIGYPIVGMGNITYDGHLEMSDHSYVELPKAEFEKLKLRNDDVMFNRTNSTELVGKTTYWNLDLNAVLASYLVRLRLKENTNTIFFTYLMNTRFFKRLFSMRCKKAVNQSNISPTLLKKFDVYLPPIELQIRFASIVKQVEQIKFYQENSKRQIGNFLNGLTQKAFGGKLVC